MINNNNEIYVDRRQFAEVLNLSKARVAQLIKTGLPEDPAGIPLFAGSRWYLSRISHTATNLISRRGLEDRVRQVAMCQQQGHAWPAADTWPDPGWEEGEFHIMVDIAGAGTIQRFALAGRLGAADELTEFADMLLKHRPELRPYIRAIQESLSAIEWSEATENTQK